MKINLIGSGSLGSFTALLLSKTGRAFGWRLKLFDFDEVERHNLDNQFFQKTDVGKKKIIALKELLSLFSDAEVEIADEKAAKDSQFSGVVVMLVDSMDSRKAILRAAIGKPNIPLVIDARSGGKVAVIYAFDPRDPDSLKSYEETLYDSQEAMLAPCANPETVDVIFAIASLIGRLLVLFQQKKLIGMVRIIINYEDLPSIGFEDKIRSIRKLFENL